MAELERARQIHAASFRKAVDPIIRDLAAAGIWVKGLQQLSPTDAKYEAAIPILLDHFGRNYPDGIRAYVVRSLAHRRARRLAWEPLLKTYLQEPNRDGLARPGEFGSPSSDKDGLADALSEMARPDDIDHLIALISDPANGPSRVFFVKNLSRSKSQRAFETLVRLSKDAEIAAEIEFKLKNKLRRQAKQDRARSATRQ
jgi:HEAT repeat protein